MPSTLTHYLFNKEFNIVKEYKSIFLLGGQGADVFFFYGYNIIKRENIKFIREIGAKIHQINPDKLYMNMLAYAFNTEGEEKEILIHFIKGFMYHYALDRLIHPYVFYHTGFPYTNKKYNSNHAKFESILDSLLLKNNGSYISTRNSIKANKKHILICSKMLAKVLNEYFSSDHIKEDTYYKAYSDFRFVRLLVDSKYGVKKAMFNTFMKNSTIDNICQPKSVKDDHIYDYLNNKHSIWIHPTYGIKKTQSIEDLFNEAKLDCRIIDNIMYNFKNNIVTQRKISKLTDNINHDGKKLNMNMTYFKIIWK